MSFFVLWFLVAPCIVLYSGESKVAHYQGCPSNCSFSLQGGRCEANGCVCAPGHGGSSCSFRSSTIFYEHRVFVDFDRSHLRPLDLSGWSPPRQTYDKFCRIARPQFIVEVGVWKGLSASHLAGYLKDQGSGVLLCVDTWLGALEFWNRRSTGGAYDPARNLHLQHGYPSVYYSFLSNMVHLGLQDYIIPFPAPSRMAATIMSDLKVLADLIHIDAAHEYDDIREDIRLWWPLVAPGGVLLGDDFNPVWPGVVRAAKEFAKENHLKLIVHDSKWAVVKPL